MKFTIPEENRKQIGGAIMALIAAVLGLTMTLGSQAVFQWLQVDPVPVDPNPWIDPVYPVYPEGGDLQALGDTHFDNIVTTGDVTAGDDVIATDNLFAYDDLWVVGYGVIGEYLRLTEITVQTVVTNGAITPVGTYTPITSAAAATLSGTTAIVDGAAIGQLLLLINENAADAITINDGANTALTGNIALGPKDALMMIWDGADWVEFSASNN